MVAVPPMGPEQQHLFAESSFEVVDPSGTKKEGDLLRYGDEVVLVDDQKMVWNNAQGEVGGIGPKVPGSRGEMHISFRRLQASLPEEASAAAAGGATGPGANTASTSDPSAASAGTTASDAAESKPAPTTAVSSGTAAAATAANGTSARATASSGDGSSGRERSVPFPSPVAAPAVPASGAMPPLVHSPTRNGSGSASLLSGPTSPVPPPPPPPSLSPHSPGTSELDKETGAGTECDQSEVVHYGDSDVLLDVVRMNARTMLFDGLLFASSQILLTLSHLCAYAARISSCGPTCIWPSRLRSGVA